MLRSSLLLVSLLALSSLTSAQPLSTAFTLQGQLKNGAAPATGLYDARFRLYDAPTGGTQLGPTLCIDNVDVTATGGTLTTQVDFGTQFAGQQRFLEVEVRQDAGLNCANAAGYTTLSPRQALTATPNAVYSLNAAVAATANSATTATSATNASALNGQPSSFYTNAANLTGTLPSTGLSGTYSSQLNLSNASNVFQGSFSGSGAGLTSVPWSGLTFFPSVIQLLLGGTLHANTGTLDTLNVATGVSGPEAIKFGDTVRLRANGSDGDVLRLGSDNRKVGFTSESSQQTLNFDMNFRFTGTDIFNPGAAIRLDGRAGFPPIQFLTRLPASTTEVTAMQIGNTGNVAIGTNPSTSNRLSVLDNSTTASTFALYSENDSTNGYAGVFRGYGPDVLSIINLGSGRGVFIQSPTDTALWANSTNGMGIDARTVNSVAVGGYASAASGSTVGVSGNSASTGGRGISGVAGATSGPTYGAYGETYSNAGVGIGGYAWSSSGVTFGGYARTVSPNGRGMMGDATATIGANYGVVGSTNSAGGFGVYSNGNMGASGTKPFRIDHPDDPAHKYLMHYSSESPEAINFYRGTVTLNDQGEATIDLPPYFAKINKDPSYQLTAVGAPMPLLHVAAKISQAALEQGAKAAPEEPAPLCSFTIAGGAPNGEVCWRIEAVRNDRWVQAHGAPVEVAKQGPEDGTYQHPDLYGQPASRATFYRELPPPPAPPAPREQPEHPAP